MTSLEVLFTSADFGLLAQRDLGQTACVVCDVLRATSSMVMALANGAAGLRPVEGVSEAVAWRAREPGVLLAGERDGVRIRAPLTGGLDFDLGNSPREFIAGAVQGRTIVITTTNGTRALRACMGARLVLASSFLNLSATAERLRAEAPPALRLVCSGTQEEAAYEDVLGAGALANLLWADYSDGAVADSARMARALFLQEQHDLVDAFSRSQNGRRLLSKPELRDDLAFCAQQDTCAIVARLGPDGVVRKWTQPPR